MSKSKAINLAAAEKALGVELYKNRKASQALHEAVTAYRAARRSGTHSTLTKATVDLSGINGFNNQTILFIQLRIISYDSTEPKFSFSLSSELDHGSDKGLE